MADLIINKKFSLVVITVLLGVILILVPLSIKFVIGSAIESEMNPITASLSGLEGNVKTLYDMEIDQIKGSAIAGYKKFEKYSDKEGLFLAMDSSSQNTEAIRRALLYPESKILLIQLDPKKTKLFELYFSGES